MHHLKDTNNMESKNIINLKEVTGRELKVNRTLSSSEDDKDTQKVRWFYILRVDSAYSLPCYTDTAITGVRKQPCKLCRLGGLSQGNEGDENAGQ